MRQEESEGQVGQRACGIDRGVLEGEVGQGGKGGTEAMGAGRERGTSGTDGMCKEEKVGQRMSVGQKVCVGGGNKGMESGSDGGTGGTERKM